MATMSILGLHNWDNTVLQPMLTRLPDGLDPLAVETELIAECAELEVLYPDPVTFKQILRAWSIGRADVWNRMAKALQAEYNITENYDRSEEWTDTGSGSSDSTNKAKGYPQGESLITQSKNEATGSSTSTHTGRVHGNIGVRSAQELVEQELALAVKADLEEVIIKDFKSRFCLLVY